MKSRNKTRLVHGVGTNYANYQVNITAVIDGKQKILWRCPYYSSWKGMLRRCNSASVHDHYPTYIGCTVAPEWHSFMAFRAWMQAQEWEGKHLDKDILHPGNKLYSPNTCVFVPCALNVFTGDSGAARGEWPIGVYWYKASGKLRARCGNPFTGKEELLGYFTDPAEAHEAWRARKHEHACRYADQQTDPRMAEALRSRYATHGDTK